MKIKSIFICVFFSLLLLSSCKVISIVPTRSEVAIAQVQKASLATDALYDTMISANPDKTYESYRPNYSNVKSQIQEILKTDSEREKSKIILKMANDIQTKFLKYEQDHLIAGSLNSAQLLTYKDYMHALWESLANAETHYK